jgi:cellulose synthase (UDP-forming)
MYMNGAYVGSTPLPHSDKSSGDMSTVVPVPVADMRPFSNALMMQFAFKVAKKEKCEDTAPLNLRGSIGGDSYLDSRGIAHWATLPNLEIFANAGYPFTRMADLQDTAVVMPEAPSTAEMEMFLAMMGHFGAQTGYPVIHVTVTTPEGMKSLNKDFLVMGTADDISGAIAMVNDALPVKFRNGGLQVEDMHGFFAALEHAWWRLRSSNNVKSGKLETAGGLPDALMEGIEWPRGSNRSVVLIALRDQGVAANFVNLFLQTSQSSDISQSVSVLNGTKFTSYRIGNDLYHVGHLSWFLWVGLLFGTSPWLLVMVVIVLCFLIAALLRAILRRHARRRLQEMSAA